ncbi:MAG: YdcF family protein [Clostridium sp.]|nr:YdcF family protein [Clostridium sp.]
MKTEGILKKIVKLCIILALAGGLLLFGVNLYVIEKEKDFIFTAQEAEQLEGVDCIMVLGCGVRQDGTPSAMLQDRLQQGIDLYGRGVSDRLLMSGDHGKVNYDEVNLMKQFAMDSNVPSQDIFMDHAGFSTYESMYRARDIFQVKRIVIVTQRYHMYRALYVAQAMGMEAYGVASDPRAYGGQYIRDARELLARPKDWIYTMVMPKPTYLGEAIPVSGDGNVTNDKEENRGARRGRDSETEKK